MINKIFCFIFLIVSFVTGSDTDSITTRIIYYIHGDASYLFHNENGEETRADFRMLNQALCVAGSTTNSEVFILHHKPARKILFFFTLKNLDFYYFRKGRLIEKSTHGLKEQSGVHQQFDLIKRITPHSSENIRTFFIYYGHRIPEDEGYGYNSSQTDKSFNISILKEALNLYNNKFELILLSTCKNGTRHSISQILPLTKFIIASPEDLSLYHISSLPFKIFNREPEITTESFIKVLTEYAFRKLKSQTLTITTISIYDSTSLTNPKGVKVLYNAPHFGIYKKLKVHSGWSSSEEDENN